MTVTTVTASPLGLRGPDMCHDILDAPALLTVYTAFGEYTVSNVREDSIELDSDGTLLAEAKDTRNPRLFRFQNVIGYSTLLV